MLGIAGIAVAGLPGMGVTAITGFQIGVTLGTLLFPPQGPKLDRGRVDEMKIQGAGQGQPIPLIYGRNRTAGTIIWATGLRERTSTSSSGGKGGGGGATTTDYSYSTSLAVYICEGTLSKVRRIWANEKVIYDWRTGGSPTYASWIDSSKVRIYLGNQMTADAAIEADKGAGNVPAFKGIAYVVFEALELAEVGGQIPNFTFEVESDHANLQVALNDLAARSGLASADYDFSALAAYPTRGMVVAARTEAARVMDAYAKANWFEIVETGGQIKSVIRTGVSVAKIPADDIGAAEPGAESQSFVLTTRAEETELPLSFAVNYQSEALDFLQWSQTARRSVRWSDQQENVSFSLGLADEYARYLADSLLMEAWAARSSHTFTLPYKYMRLDPGDVVTIPDEGGEDRVVRILEMSMGLLAQIEVTAVDDDPVIYLDPGLPASIPTGGGAGVDSTTTADLLSFEANAVVDSLADAPQLGFAAGRTSAGWKGGEAQIDPRLQRYAGGFNRRVALFYSSSTFGYSAAGATGLLGNVGGFALPYGLDTVNTVRVVFTNGVPESITYAEMVTEGRNLAVLGKEIIQFQTATLISGSTYELSNLLRYRRGSDYLLTLEAMGAVVHASLEGFILITEKVKNYPYSPSGIGTVENFRIIETGKDYSGGLPSYGEPLTMGGDSRKPYGPCDLRYSGDRSGGDADVIVSFKRRVRKKGDLYSGDDAPLDESSEGYKVEIWDTGLTGLIATYSHTSGDWTYTIANQTTDGVNASAFAIVFYQTCSEPGILFGWPSFPKTVSLGPDVP